MGLRDLLRPRYDGALAATVGGIVDRFRDRAPALALDDRDRLDGRTCLVTGANRGLGLAVSIELAKRGGHVLLACRSGIPEVMDVVRRASGGAGTVEAMKLDLGDLDQIERFVSELAEDGAGIDVAVMNAGVVPRSARRTRDGFDEQLQVNFLSNVLLLRRLLERGVIPNRTFGAEPGESDDEDAGDRATPRIVIVTSESHRTAPPIDFGRLGMFREWGVREAVTEYGYSKLLLETWSAELSRRLRRSSAVGEGTAIDVAVHTACPGAVNTGIAREAPPWAKPALDLTMRALFKAPEDGATPIVYLAASRAVERETGLYLHVKKRKERSDEARSADNGRRLWDASERLLADAGHAFRPAATATGTTKRTGT